MHWPRFSICKYLFYFGWIKVKVLILAICEQPLADGWSRARGLRCFLLSFGTEGGGGGLYCSEAGSNGEALCVGVKAGTSVPGLGAEGGTCAFSSGRSNGETLWPLKAFWLIVDEGTWAFSSDSNKWFLFIGFLFSHTEESASLTCRNEEMVQCKWTIWWRMCGAMVVIIKRPEAWTK